MHPLPTSSPLAAAAAAEEAADPSLINTAIPLSSAFSSAVSSTTAMGKSTDSYCKTLNIPSDSSLKDIRAAYKSLAERCRSDEPRFKAITQAYEGLVDRQNDRALVAGGGLKKTSVYSSDGDVRAPAMSSAFSSSILRKPPPVERKLECTLEELFTGCKKQVKFTRDVVAPNGAVAKKEVTQTIKVRPGWKKGMTVTLLGMGDERPGCIASDAVFVIAERRHPTFKRSGADLVAKVEVPLASALTGWSFSLRLLDGERLSCTFRDEIVHPGYEKVYKGLGMPIAADDGGGREGAGERGDLRIKFRVVFPKELTEEQRAGVVELLKGCT